MTERFNPSTCIAPAQQKSELVDALRSLHQQSQSFEVGYTSGGNPAEKCPECDVESPDCFAKIVSNVDGGEQFFVKVGANGLMFDPWSNFAEGIHNKHARLLGRAAWEFKEVNQRAFDFYKKFLQTRNNAWKNNAEREFKNA